MVQALQGRRKRRDPFVAYVILEDLAAWIWVNRTANYDFSL
jgi:hypothetical protein